MDQISSVEGIPLDVQADLVFYLPTFQLEALAASFPDQVEEGIIKTAEKALKQRLLSECTPSYITGDRNKIVLAPKCLHYLTDAIKNGYLYTVRMACQQGLIRADTKFYWKDVLRLPGKNDLSYRYLSALEAATGNFNVSLLDELFRLPCVDFQLYTSGVVLLMYIFRSGSNYKSLGGSPPPEFYTALTFILNRYPTLESLWANQESIMYEHPIVAANTFNVVHEAVPLLLAYGFNGNQLYSPAYNKTVAQYLLYLAQNENKNPQLHDKHDTLQTLRLLEYYSGEDYHSDRALEPPPSSFWSTGRRNSYSYGN